MLNISYYTDPLCCWSWAFEPQWRRLLYEYGEQISFQLKMGGLIPAWNAYHDTTNNVSRPIQMGPVWMHAAQLSGMPMNTRIWMEDPPASSYPACIAVCCAGLQSQQAADQLLRRLRQGIMLEGINIALPENLYKIAQNYSLEEPGKLQISKFIDDFEKGRGTDAFKRDMEDVKSRSISRFPALIVRAENGQAILITGYRAYPDLITALSTLDKHFLNTAKELRAEEYIKKWPNATAREISEITGLAST